MSVLSVLRDELQTFTITLHPVRFHDFLHVLYSVVRRRPWVFSSVVNDVTVHRTTFSRYRNHGIKGNCVDSRRRRCVCLGEGEPISLSNVVIRTNSRVV